MFTGFKRMSLQPTSQGKLATTGRIVARNTTLGTMYERYSSSGERIQQVGVYGFIRELDNKSYFIIHDFRGNLLNDANEYLNVTIGESGYKKRELAFTALKHLYSFISLFSIGDCRLGLNYEQVRQLVHFLDGGKTPGITFNLDLGSRRRNQTVNTYLGVYRDYFKKIFRVDSEALFDTSVIAKSHGIGFLGHTKRTVQLRYKANKRIPISRPRVPKYIKSYEFDRIMDLINRRFTLREAVIVKLMYEYGLRLGEVLGLTIEDIEIANSEFSRLVIRNRLSDKPFQSAKGVMRPSTPHDYTSAAYQTLDAGYQVILIDSDMSQMIGQYIDETRDALVLSVSPNKSYRLQSNAQADRVSKNPTLGPNQYIFLNQRLYTPLTAGGWNYVLRRIFTLSHIQLDKHVRLNNLSHRFRHGFAMNKVAEGYSVEQLANALRHRDINSCLIYYNPDEEDKLSLMLKHERKMRDHYGFD